MRASYRFSDFSGVDNNLKYNASARCPWPIEYAAMPHTRRRIKTRREFVKQSAMAAGMLTFCKSQIFPTLNTAADKDAINKLRSRFSGHLIIPGDPRYDSARRVLSMNPGTDKRPSLVAQCKNEEDVLRCIDLLTKINWKLRFGREITACWAGVVVMAELS